MEPLPKRIRRHTENGRALAEANKRKDENAPNCFRYIIKNQMVVLEKLFKDVFKYDRIQLVVDYICEGQIDKLFEVIDSHFKDTEGAKGSILIQRNQKG